jgi:hypothetical protein
VNKLEEIRKGMDRYKELRNEFKTKFEREKENPKNQHSLILLYSPPLNAIARETFDSMIEMDILSLIEEKDKALEQFADEDNWIDIWDPGAECCKREWAPFGNPADIARAAFKSTKEE